MAEATARLLPGMTVGFDTFRGTNMSSTMLRAELYQKNQGAVTEDKGITRTDSPISGCLLLSRTTTTSGVKDPMTGTSLKYKGGHAQVTTPVQKQSLLHSRQFYLTKDVDISIQMLRGTTKVTRYTNEKVGTAGTPTGMDNSLKAYKEMQALQRQQLASGAQSPVAAQSSHL